MKKGRKKIEREEAGSGKPEPALDGSKKAGSDDSGTFRVTSDMIGGNPDGIDGIRALQMIAGGIIALIVVWFVFHNILQLI
jgi:hypothetical protein